MGRQWREHAAAGSARRRQDAPGDRARARGHNRRPRARSGINKRTISKKRAGGLPTGLSSCPDAHSAPNHIARKRLTVPPLRKFGGPG
jgi:hypothetical protein